MKFLIITGIEHIEHTGDLGSRAGNFQIQVSGTDMKATDENGKEISLDPKS